jgi:hypothetical protein
MHIIKSLEDIPDIVNMNNILRKQMTQKNNPAAGLGSIGLSDEIAILPEKWACEAKVQDEPLLR